MFAIYALSFKYVPILFDIAENYFKTANKNYEIFIFYLDILPDVFFIFVYTTLF